MKNLASLIGVLLLSVGFCCLMIAGRTRPKPELERLRSENAALKAMIVKLERADEELKKGDAELKRSDDDLRNADAVLRKSDDRLYAACGELRRRYDSITERKP